MPRLTDDESSDNEPRAKDIEMKEDEEEDDAKNGANDAADEEDGDEEEDLGEDEYEIEQIIGHKFNKGVLEFLVKWKGYDDPADQTWEPEANCQGAPAVVQGYFEKLGGRPTPAAKRGRQPGSTPGTATKKAVKREEAATPAEDKWKPPTGSWEDEIRAIDTLEKTDNDLICYIQWVNGRRTQHPVHVVYKKCPQQMLQFYESHLVFRDQNQSM